MKLLRFIRDQLAESGKSGMEFVMVMGASIVSVLCGLGIMWLACTALFHFLAPAQPGNGPRATGGEVLSQPSAELPRQTN
jgi:hypothetical protein